MARFYWDEDADVRLADALRQRGHDVETTVDAERRESGDEEQLVYATKQRRLLVTHNVADFPAIHVRWLHEGRQHAGILVLVGYEPVGVLLHRIETLLARQPPDGHENQLFYLGAMLDR